MLSYNRSYGLQPLMAALYNTLKVVYWHHSGQNRSPSLQAEEIAIECGAENVFFCESENGTKSLKVNYIGQDYSCTLYFFMKQLPKAQSTMCGLQSL